MMPQGFQNKASNYLISTQDPCFSPVSSQTHTPLVPGSSTLSQFPDSAHTLSVNPSLHSAQPHLLQGGLHGTPGPISRQHSAHWTTIVGPFLPTFLTVSGLGRLQQSGGASRQVERGLLEGELPCNNYNEVHIYKLHNLISFDICIPL